jgi:hypothetical protein
MPLDKASLGTRFSCFQCGSKFYDLNKPDPLCPTCGADQRDDPSPDPREEVMARFAKSRRRKKKKKEEETQAEDSFMEPLSMDDDKTGSEDDEDEDDDE